MMLEALARAVASRECRYYKRVVRATTTTCWGLAIGIGLLVTHAHTQAQSTAQPEAPTPVWQIELDPAGQLQVAAGPSAIFVSGGTPALQAFAIEDGRLLWSGDQWTGATLLSDGPRLFLVAPGTITALGAGDGTLRWASALPPGEALSAAGDGVVAVAIGTSLFVFDGDDGGGLAAATLDAPVQIPPVIAETLVIVATRDGRLTGLDRTTGRRVWALPLATSVDAVSVYGGRVYLTGRDGGLYCFRARNGQFEWRFSLYSRGSGSAAFGDRLVYVALFDNTVQAIDRISGTRKWYQTLSGRPVTPVWPVGDRLFVAQADGVVTVLNAASGARVARLAAQDEARRLEAGGLVPGPSPAAFTLTTGTSSIRRLSLWRPQP
jgi:outer membrane protein assembly factor BamB